MNGQRCEYKSGNPPTQAQFVTALGVWRMFWPCGCVSFFQSKDNWKDSWPSEFGDIEIVDKDESHDGSGEGNELALAHYEYYYEGTTVH